MNFFTFDIKKVIFIVCLLLLPLFAVNVKIDPLHPPWYIVPFNLFVTLVQNTYFQFSKGVISTTETYVNLLHVKTKNAELLKENRELKVHLSLMNELKLENNRLNELLQFKKKNEMQILAAQVISQDLISDYSTVRINRGTFHGVKAGLAVINMEGVVGYIFRPELFTSQVLLLTDRYAVIDALLQKSRVRGIVEGSKSKNLSQLRYLERVEDISLGDKVVTSGLDPFFPKGVPIGHVVEVEKKNFKTAAARVLIKPVIEINRLEEVFVILNPGTQNATNANPPPVRNQNQSKENGGTPH